MIVRPSFALVTVVVALLAAASVVTFEVRSRAIDEDAINAFRQENLFWHASQFRFEIMRLVDTVSDYALDPTKQGAAHVVERFDVAWSRLEIFERGRMGDQLRAIDGVTVVDDVRAVLERHEPTILKLDAGVLVAAVDIARDLRVLLPDSQTYIGNVSAAEEERMAQVQRAILDSNDAGRTKTMAAVLLGVALLIAAYAQASTDRRRLSRQKQLTRDAEQAAEAKRRFLTMMSHELRTPMNGVIGMLALLERQPMTDKQAELTCVARSSAVEMLGLIEDILDLSDLQSGGVAPEPRAVTLEAILELARDLIVRRIGCVEGRIGLHALGDPLQSVWLDDLHAAKAIRQIALFLAQRMKIAVFDVVLETRRNEVVAMFTSSEPAGARWTMADFMGPLTDDAAVIQTEAIGPAVARGLLQHLHGKGVLHRTPDGRLVVILTFPAPPIGESPAAATAAPLRAAS